MLVQKYGLSPKAFTPRSGDGAKKEEEKKVAGGGLFGGLLG